MRDKFRKLVAFTLQEVMDNPPAAVAVQSEYEAWTDKVIDEWAERVGFFEVADQ